MTEPAATQPQYRTGLSVSEYLKQNDVIETPPENTPVIDTPPPVQEQSPEPSIEQKPEEVTPVDDNAVSVSMLDFSPEGVEPQQVQQQQQPQITWKDSIKGVSAAEILKELGVSDFALEIDQHIKNGGAPIDYLNAKAIDFNTVSDADLVKKDLQKKYSGFTQTDIDRMFNRKYGISEEMSEDEVQDRQLELKAQGHVLRQAEIENQKKFKVADAIPVKSQQNSVSDEEVQQKYQETINWFNSQEATKNLMSSKRVVIDLGENGSFNFNIDKPESLMDSILSGETWRRLTSINPKEPDINKLVPDVAKLQRIGLMANNPNYEKDIFNFGVASARRILQKEGQNITPPGKILPLSPDGQKKGADWSTARTGVVGDGKR